VPGRFCAQPARPCASPPRSTAPRNRRGAHPHPQAAVTAWCSGASRWRKWNTSPVRSAAIDSRALYAVDPQSVAAESAGHIGPDPTVVSPAATWPNARMYEEICDSAVR
jgi:hypothetical protein